MGGVLQYTTDGSTGASDGENISDQLSELQTKLVHGKKKTWKVSGKEEWTAEKRFEQWINHE